MSQVMAPAPCYQYNVIPTPVGSVPRPELPLTIEGPKGTANVVALFDSGSDVILVPKSIGDLIGYSPKATINTYGVSGSASGQIFQATVTVGGLTFTAPVFVSTNEDAPVLVGRAGVWNRFSSFTFYNANQQMCFGAAQPTTFVSPIFAYIGLFVAGAVATWMLMQL